MKQKKLFSFIVLTLALFSCGRLKNTGQEFVENSGQKIKDKGEQLTDKIIARYDADTADTKWNKLRFAEFFGFNPTPDVKNIYCYADEIGIDHDYTFSFNCDTSTVNKIVSYLELTQSDKPDNYGEGLQHDFKWWDKNKIQKIKPYLKKGDHQTFWYLWYDKNESKVYYFEFDM
jgi:hypothetical protein